MLLSYSQIIKTPIASIESSTKIGEIKELVLSSHFSAVDAFVLEPAFFDRQTKVICKIDVIELCREGLVVNNFNSVSNLEEVVKVKDLIKKQYLGIGQKAFDQNGVYIGRVVDFFVDNTDLSIKKVFLKKGLTEKVIPTSSIVQFDGKKLIIRDADRKRIADIILKAQPIKSN